METYIDNNYDLEKIEKEYYSLCKIQKVNIVALLFYFVCGVAEVQQSQEKSYEAFHEEKEFALKERMKHISDTFQQYLLFLIGEKGLSHSQVYKRAFITKQLFSKITLNPNYHPIKLRL